MKLSSQSSLGAPPGFLSSSSSSSITNHTVITLTTAATLASTTIAATIMSPPAYLECLNLCQNEGQCIMMGNLFTCICPSEFTGMYCDLPLRTTPFGCHPDPCNSHGNCIPYINGSFYLCICQSGYSGTYCEISPTTTTTTTTHRPLTNTCKPNPCQFHGTCVPFKNGTFFMCVCQAGYSGKYCERQSVTTTMTTTTIATTTMPAVSTNECYPNPCFNDGICSLTSDGKFSGCLCPSSEFSGYFCQNYEVVCKRISILDFMCAIIEEF